MTIQETGKPNGQLLVIKDIPVLDWTIEFILFGYEWPALFWGGELWWIIGYVHIIPWFMDSVFMMEKKFWDMNHLSYDGSKNMYTWEIDVILLNGPKFSYGFTYSVQ